MRIRYFCFGFHPNSIQLVPSFCTLLLQFYFLLRVGSSAECQWFYYWNELILHIRVDLCFSWFEFALPKDTLENSDLNEFQNDSTHAIRYLWCPTSNLGFRGSRNLDLRPRFEFGDAQNWKKCTTWKMHVLKTQKSVASQINKLKDLESDKLSRTPVPTYPKRILNPTQLQRSKASCIPLDKGPSVLKIEGRRICNT